MRKMERAARNERVKAVILNEPTLTNKQIQERFGCSREVVIRIRKECNIEKPDSFELLRKYDKRRIRSN